MRRRLIIAVHDGLDQLAVASVAESDEEAEAVERIASRLGPVWVFDLDELEREPYWSEPEPAIYDPTIRESSDQ